MGTAYQEFCFDVERFRQMSGNELYRLVPQADLLKSFLKSLVRLNYSVESSKKHSFQRCPTRILFGAEGHSENSANLLNRIESFLAESELPYVCGKFLREDDSLPNLED